MADQEAQQKKADEERKKLLATEQLERQKQAEQEQEAHKLKMQEMNKVLKEE